MPEVTPYPDDHTNDAVSMAEIAEAGLALDALAAHAHGDGDGDAAAPAGMDLLLALQASMLRAEVERDDLRLAIQSASNALDALAEGRGRDIPDVATLAALRTAIDRPTTVKPLHVVRRHPRRRRALATLALAGVFSVVGVSAAAAASHPGDQLYPLRVAVIGRVDSDPVVSREVLDAASSALTTSAITTSPTADATETATSEKLLAQAAALVPQVKNIAVRKQLDARLAALTAALHERMAHRPPLTPTPSGQPGAILIPTPSGAASPSPAPSPTPHRQRHKKHRVLQHPTPSPKPTRSPRSHPHPTPGPSLSPTPVATPTPTVSPAPKPTRIRKSPSATPTPSVNASGTDSPTPAPGNT